MENMECETHESEKIEKTKEEICKEIQGRLESINVGSYVADGYGEDLFLEADNLEDIIETVKKIIDQAYAEKWSQERLNEEISKITITIDVSGYENLPGFFSFNKGNEPLENFIDLENVIRESYQP